MSDFKLQCLRCWIPLFLNRRFVSCLIFMIAVVPFLGLNFLVYQNGDREEHMQQVHRFNYYLQGGTGKIKRRFLKHLLKQNGSSLLNDSDTNDRNQSKDDYKKGFYVREQILAEQHKAANQKYEEACARNLGGTNGSFSEGNVSNHLKAIPKWQIQLTKCRDVEKTKFFLTSALQVRIYKADKAKWTIKELKQWLHYMFWAGIEHVYICDHYHFPSERLIHQLKTYIDAKLVTYINWSHIQIPMTAQVACYQHIIHRFGTDSAWQIAVDMDEYPFMPNDIQEQFLVRYLKSLRFSVSEVSLHNFLMLGHGDRSQTMAIERITRMTPEPANVLDKPVYRPLRVVASIHHNLIKHGRRTEAVDEEIRLLHYWGSRINHFGPDPPDLNFKTVEYTALRDALSDTIRHSLLSFGELDAFSNSTGP